MARRTAGAQGAGAGGRARARFYDDPIGFFIQADDETKAAIWAYVESRQPAELKEIV